LLGLREREERTVEVSRRLKESSREVKRTNEVGIRLHVGSSFEVLSLGKKITKQGKKRESVTRPREERAKREEREEEGLYSHLSKPRSSS